jgi:hypothetical protein
MKEATEVDYLRYLVDGMYGALGPADDAIVMRIQKEFEQETGERVPKGYRYEALED